ncbi:phospholipase A2 [Oesophagostomum dentatum]|uniref:Phospholipase A2 n=1 Tax=Oesophagostomum dentatum TaxID=61180 RepID=A0A0B1TJ67_OESDE|nr:phospholipase A2 [Oesophagostomum dentatum]
MITALTIPLPVFYLAASGPFLAKLVQAGLLDFNRVAKCELDYGILTYNHYGCWCGIGGHYTPVDEIDRCCETHDNCYRDARHTHGCWRITLYFGRYRFECIDKEAFCTGKTSCQKALCECDVMAVRCWKKYGKPKYKKECPEDIVVNT